MSLLFTVIGATLAALLELSLIPYLAIGDGQPHLVAVLTVVVTMAAGMEYGVAWAFSGGLTLDILGGRPIGVSVFALLLVAGASVVVARGLMRLRAIAPVFAVPVLSAVYSLVVLALIGSLSAPIPVTDPLRLLAPGLAHDFVLGLILGPLIVSIHDRRAAEERIDW